MGEAQFSAVVTHYILAQADSNSCTTSHDDDFNILFPSTAAISPLPMTQEPYENQMCVFTVKFEDDETNAMRKKSIIEKICEMKKSKTQFSIYFLNGSGTEKYVSYLDMQIDDFFLGWLNLSKMEFYQKFRHSTQFNKAVKKPHLSFEFDLETVKVNFGIYHGNDSSNPPETENKDKVNTTTEVYQLRLRFSNIEKSHVVIEEHADYADVYLLLRSPLELWRTKDCLYDVDSVNDDTKWIKTVHLKSKVKALHNVNLSKLLGDSRTVKLCIKPKNERYQKLIDSMSNYGFRLNFANVAKQTLPKNPPYCISTDNFSCDWYLQALYSLGYHTKLQFTTELRDFIYSKKQDARFVPSLERTYVVISDHHQAPLLRTLKHFLSEARLLDEVIPEHTYYIRRVVITPTRQVYLPQTLMHANRILREFSREYAISVTFRNDDFSRLNDQYSSQEFINDTLTDALSKGVLISKRQYQLLGCSGSQLRNHACWLYATDEKKSCASSILNWIGDLEHIRIPGKYIARVGQCFSKTKPVDLSGIEDLKLSMDEPDIRGGLDDYCFTDGVGRISYEMLKEVFTQLDEGFMPSAFQMRLGGAKGMLTLDPTLKGKQILIRKSMNKFHSAHRTLEVSRIAQPTSLNLNRQVITLLCHHRGDFTSSVPKDLKKSKDLCGVSGGFHEFHVLLINMLHDIADTFLFDEKAAGWLSSRSNFPCAYSDLQKAGFSLVGDPLFRATLQVVAAEKIEKIKTKFNVEVPTHAGRNLFGVVDETGSLEYGQVFIQYSPDIRKPGANPMVATGPVLVSKMPSLHPGDVRNLMAVDVIALRHVVDCIVFPQKGPRPHPDEMSGSDLDGDEYFVTWHPGFILRYGNATPMDYRSKSVDGRPNPVTLKDMVNFLVNFIYRDVTGQVASAHVAWADQEGIYAEKCLALCKLHSFVIDSNKTGYLPEELSNQNLGRNRPYRYPDFMGKLDHKDTYHSKSVLGRMYRLSRRVLILLSDNSNRQLVNLDERFLLPGHEHHMDSARELEIAYVDSVLRLQQEYGIETEAELVSGCFLKMTSNISVSHDDQYNTRKLVQSKYLNIVDQTRKMFYQDLGIEKDRMTKTAMLKASACYHVTYGKAQSFFSFAWIFSDLLVEVLRCNNTTNATHIRNPALDMLDQSIRQIPQHELCQYLGKFEKRDNLLESNSAIYYVLLKWWEWNRIDKFLNSTQLLSLVHESLEHMPIVNINYGEILVMVMEHLALTYRRKHEAEFVREIVLAQFRIALLADWSAVRGLNAESRKIAQPIKLVKGKWIKIQREVKSFHDVISRRFPECNFEIRPCGLTGYLHVKGPAMFVYDIADNFNSIFDETVATVSNRRDRNRLPRSMTALSLY